MRDERRARGAEHPVAWGHRDDGSSKERVDALDARIDEDPHRGAGLSADALDAHRQVLEMATTIEILTRDFENQQRELLQAYKTLKEYTGHKQSPTDRSDAAGAAVSKLFRRGCQEDDEDALDGAGCCSHQDDLHELRKMIDVKDTALNEALQQRNEYRIELERAEALIKEFRSMHLDGGGSRQGWRVHPTVSTMGAYHASGIAMPCTQASLAPGYVGNGGGSFSSGGSAAASMMLGCNGAIEVPRNERFDHESTYQRKENDELFWRKQYKEAVRMRKKYGLVNPSAGAGGNSSSSHAPGHYQHSNTGGGQPRPSLKIFSFPDNRRQKGIKDENVPFSRYIGISARQHEIIKEQHRMLA